MLMVFISHYDYDKAGSLMTVHDRVYELVDGITDVAYVSMSSCEQSNETFAR
jgi:hypothetical protein